MGQLTGGVAHDFNNLLTVIRGSVDLLRRPNLTDVRRNRYIDAIGDTAERAARLTNQLLAFSRRQALTPQVFDARESLDAIRSMVGTLSGSRIRISLESTEAPCLIHVDRNQFDTAVINMAVNARDAMGSEGALSIKVRSVFRPAGHAQPIPPSPAISSPSRCPTPGRAFRPTASIASSSRFSPPRVGQGTGLGLSQVFGFAKQSGGEVMVESKAGHGATFTPLPAPNGRRCFARHRARCRG